MADVPRFLERYPHVSLDLVIDGSLVDIVEQGFDAGVRLAEAVPQDMIAVPFGDDLRFLAVAAPSYVQASGRRLYYPGHRHVPSSLRAFIDVMREAS
jgi:DNA-binding transcriptional LysR family regulator